MNSHSQKAQRTFIVPPPEAARKVEGGLRTRGYFKHSLPEMPLVTVITVVLNGEKYLEQTIHSVTNQSYVNIEYIIIDGGSSDSTLDIIRKYDQTIDYWASENDSGIYYAMNKGISLATGDIIGIINSDDYYTEDAISKIVTAALHNPHAGVFHANMAYIISENTTIIRHSKQMLCKADMYCMPLNHPTVFVRHELYERYGSFDVRYKFVADFDLVFRFLLDYNVCFKYLNETIAYMRDGGSTSTSRWQDTADLNHIILSKHPSLIFYCRWKAKYFWCYFAFRCKKFKLVSTMLPQYRFIRDSIYSLLATLKRQILFFT